jgi:hypothetical protein
MLTIGERRGIFSRPFRRAAVFRADAFLREFFGAWSDGRGGDAKASKTQHEEHEESRRFTEKQDNEVRQGRLLLHDRGDFKTI